MGKKAKFDPAKEYGGLVTAGPSLRFATPDIHKAAAKKLPPGTPFEIKVEGMRGDISRVCYRWYYKPAMQGKLKEGLWAGQVV